jgi:hypothetical protein
LVETRAIDEPLDEKHLLWSHFFVGSAETLQNVFLFQHMAGLRQPFISAADLTSLQGCRLFGAIATQEMEPTAVFA